METAKKKYQKHKVGGKITIKHYLNQGAKDSFYRQFYMTITVKRKVTQIKSRIFAGYTESDLITKSKEIELITNRESENLTKIIESLNPFDDDNFDIGLISYRYSERYGSLEYLVNNLLIHEIQNLVTGDKPFWKSDFKSEYTLNRNLNACTLLEYFKANGYNVDELLKKYPSEIWFFNAYLSELKYNLQRAKEFENINKTLIYSKLEPTILDYETTNFQKEFESFFSFKKDKVTNIFADMDLLLAKLHE